MAALEVQLHRRFGAMILPARALVEMSAGDQTHDRAFSISVVEFMEGD
jgi:hypothetical protein